jgi:type IV pilus assembly protein PilP
MTRVVCVMAVMALLALQACDSQHDIELQAWMNEQRAQTKPGVKGIESPKKFTPQSYGKELAMDPFNSQKLTQAFKAESKQATPNASLINPELNRRREALESFPLDSMTMVGSVAKAQQPVAIIKVDNLLYQVRVGSYLGQNYGRVTLVNETQVMLREIVQDGVGEWTERSATLQLQERSK